MIFGGTQPQQQKQKLSLRGQQLKHPYKRAASSPHVRAAHATSQRCFSCLRPSPILTEDDPMRGLLLASRL
ncbi:uncharacterized protein DMAD_05953 [Drosophila madeirensis]|uniref:Uncharacterized protein n=1 Tax=Drosophila madeirensis TaxID=30013 RepID=A0AAU9FPF3_DROMD